MSARPSDLVVQRLEMLQIGQHFLERDDAGNRRQLAGELRRDVELAERGIVVDDDRQVAGLGDHPVVALDFGLAASPVVRRNHLLRVVTHARRDFRVVQSLERGRAARSSRRRRIRALARLLDHDFEDARALGFIHMQKLADARRGDDALGARGNRPLDFARSAASLSR